MNKKEVQQRVLQNGKPLALSKFSWDEKSNAFSSIEDNLVLDFNEINNVTFNTGSDCTFNTGSGCTFNTGSGCTFNTWYGCTFNTGSGCTFNTGSGCTFNTRSSCTFNTRSDCTFNTGSGCTFNTWYVCTFNTRSDCTFNTGSGCTFNTWYGCTFNIYNFGYVKNINENCVAIIRIDDKKKIYDLDKLEKNKFIKLESDKNPIVKEIIETKFIDDGIYVLKTEPITQDKYKFYKVQKVEDCFADKDRILTVAEKNYENKTYFAHGEDLEDAIKSVNFKIASQNFDRQQIANDIKARNNVMNMYDYRLVTGSCDTGTKDWISENGLKIDTTMQIADFYKTYKDKSVYAFELFDEFYKEYFN